LGRLWDKPILTRARKGGAGLHDGAVRLSYPMNFYHVFGGTLASEIELPELPAAPAAEARWTLTDTTAPPPADPLPRLGTEAVTDGVNAVLRGSPTRYRLSYDDTGVFEITDGGRRIVWHRPAGVDVDLHAARTDLLGRVLAVALHAGDVPTLHGSGVVMGGAGVAFVAPKLHGKSTTAAALVRAGARLLSDDILAIALQEPPLVFPGIPAVNLWRDSAQRLRPAPAGGPDAGKRRIDWTGLGTRAEAPVPLGAVYLLGPVRAAPPAEVQRHRLPAVTAALALVGQAKIGALLGPGNAGAMLRQMARLANAVPVYRLTIPRELDRIDELVERLGEWHRALRRTGAGEAVE
jgi:hypothetical protein